MKPTLKAIIRFKDGTEATYHSNGNTWYCDDQHIANQLNLKRMDLPFHFGGHRHVMHAEEIAAAFDAEVIYSDPIWVEEFEPSKKPKQE